LWIDSPQKRRIMGTRQPLVISIGKISNGTNSTVKQKTYGSGWNGRRPEIPGQLDGRYWCHYRCSLQLWPSLCVTAIHPYQAGGYNDCTEWDHQSWAEVFSTIGGRERRRPQHGPNQTCVTQNPLQSLSFSVALLMSPWSGMNMGNLDEQQS